MPRNSYRYQYETSPRKLEPEYVPIKEPYKKKKTTAYQKSKVNSKTVQVPASKKHKAKMVCYLAVAFTILFTISYRNTKINESFTQTQTLKKNLATIQKENEQLEISIENSMNYAYIEQEAKTRLGMQKLTNSQKVYVSLDKRDYVEPAVEEVLIQTEEETNLFESIINKIMNIFN